MMVRSTATWGIKAIQAFTGIAFLIHGLQKLWGGWLTNPKGLLNVLYLFMPHASPVYRGFLENAVIPHAHFWAFIIAMGELLIGLSLSTGVIPRTASLFGLFVMFNYWLLKGASFDPVGADQAFFVMFLACFLSGESWLVKLHTKLRG